MNPEAANFAIEPASEAAIPKMPGGEGTGRLAASGPAGALSGIGSAEGSPLRAASTEEVHKSPRRG